MRWGLPWSQPVVTNVLLGPRSLASQLLFCHHIEFLQICILCVRKFGTRHFWFLSDIKAYSLSHPMLSQERRWISWATHFTASHFKVQGHPWWFIKDTGSEDYLADELTLGLWGLGVHRNCLRSLLAIDQVLWQNPPQSYAFLLRILLLLHLLMFSPFG